jgi:trigger factor
MQVTETSSAGLKRELKVVIGQQELGQRFDERLETVKGQVQIKGFRPGKVPAAHVKKLYGRSLMAEVLQQTLDETSRKAISDRNERPAFQPDIKMTEDKEEIEKIISGKSDLSYTMAFEVLPEIKLTDFASLKLEREVAAVGDDDVQKGLDELSTRSVSYAIEDGRAAATGDQVTIDFAGKIDGVEFPGGKATDMPVILGQGGFIPGFEEGLTGTKSGDAPVITATFPETYGEKTLAGKTALFDVVVKSVGAAKKPEINDEFAKTLGVDSLDKLKELLSSQVRQQFDQVSRLKLKRQLLDELDKSHTFELPETLVKNEFEGIWGQVKQGLEQAGKTFADEGKTEEQAKDEYQKIAERRVRLGLVIGEVGDKNKIQVTQDELRQALIGEARRYPGQEKFVYEYFEKNPAALTQLRAPIFEDKVVDYIVAIVKPSERTVSREDLLKGADDTEPAAA